MAEQERSFEEWEQEVLPELRRSPLWKSTVYRKAMYLYELAWVDCDELKADFRGRSLADQLIRSVGSVAANLEEAFGRGVQTADARRILRISLGEAREARGWYLRAHRLLPADLLQRRIALLDEIIRLLVVSIRRP